MEQISFRPTRPTRFFGEDITVDLLDFMNEHDCEFPMFATFGEAEDDKDEDEEDEDSDSMESHDLATTTSTESLTSLEDSEDGDSIMKSHDLTTTTTDTAGMAALTSLEDEWKPIFDIINHNFGVPFAQGRAFLDKAVEWFENEPKSSWSEESLSQLSSSSSSSSSEGGIRDILDYYANDGLDEDEPTAVSVEDEDVVAMRDENLTDEGPNGPIPWTLFRPRVARCR